MKNFYFFVVILAVLGPQVLGHKCVHDEIKHVPAKLYIQPDLSELEMFDSDSSPRSYQPIRILADYSGISEANTAVGAFITKKLVPAAIEFFGQLLSVIPEQRSIILNQTKCFDATIPPQMKNTKLEADLILFVITNPEQSSSTLASATACYLHPETGRPLVGRINLNPSALSLEPSEWKYQFMTIVHEMIHVLGFSHLLYKQFVDPDTRTPLNINQTVVEVDWRGAAGKAISTPRVAETARRYYNCSNITGVELENEGGPESKGSHWERRVLGNELMTSSINKDPRLTFFTLALLEDSGWYKANYDRSDSLTFGRNEGCAFIFQTCIDKETKKARFPEFCSGRNENLCTLDQSFCGLCIFDERRSLPREFKYFDDNSAGFDPYADGCPTAFPYPNADCTDPNSQAAGQPGPGSHCFTWTSNVTKKQFPACFKYECEYPSEGEPILYILNNNQKVVCPHEGAEIVQNVTNITGFLRCPTKKYICDKNFKVINPNAAETVNTTRPVNFFPMADFLDHFREAFTFAERMTQGIALMIVIGLGILAF